MSLLIKYDRWIEKLSINETRKISEENSFLFVKSQNQQLLLKIDGGIIPYNIQHQKKCDYAIYDEKNKNSNFIELKGVDIEYACDQVYETILFSEKDEDLKEIVIGLNLLKGYIVSPRPPVPDIKNSHRNKLCRKMYNLSKNKLESLFHHLVFVRCIHKNPGKTHQQDNICIVISHKNPLLI